MKKRINMSIAPDLHAQAVDHAKHVEKTDFSGYVTQLIVYDLSHPIGRSLRRLKPSGFSFRVFGAVDFDRCGA
jgi:hypothetical protein